MITETSTKEELLTAIDEAVSEMADQMLKLDDNQVNSVPFEGSWTAGQLFSHVTQSINGMAGAVLKPGEPVQRDPGEKIAGLKKTFLDLTTKFNSPDFILPKDGPFEKQVSVEELKRSSQLLSEHTAKANMNELLEGLPFGPVTKLELLHFVLYHTQRHLQQMKHIVEALEKKPG